MARQAMKMVLSVDGMTCGGCVEAVKRVILKADPDATIDVSLETGRVDVTTIAEGSDLTAAVTKAGYDAAIAA